MQLGDLDEAEWRLIKELIPTASSAKEIEQGVIRASVNGILWRMRTGQPWSRLPRQYGNHTSICRRFVQWREIGVWRDVTATLARARKADDFVGCCY